MKGKLSEKHKHPIVSVYIDKIQTQLLAIIDTGCYGSYLLLGNNKPEDYDIFTYTGNHGVAHAAGGAALPHPLVVHKIKIGDWDFELEFGLIPGTFEGCAVVLGTQFLYENKISIYINGDDFELKAESTT